MAWRVARAGSVEGGRKLSGRELAKKNARATQARLVCPGCDGRIRSTKLLEHMRACCPDLMPPGKWPGPLAASGFAAREIAHLRRAVVDLREVNEYSHRLSAENVAKSLGVAEERVRRLLRAVSKATPLHADSSSELDILYEDDDILAVHKPPFVRHHPNHRFIGGSLLNFCIGHLGYEPHVVHRLDMDTSGVAIFAKTPECARFISEQFQQKLAQKTYIALAFGSPPSGRYQFRVNAPIGFHSEIVARRMARTDGKDAITDFSVLSTHDPGEREGKGKPGRTHQIRIHAQHAHLPLVGDPQYTPEAVDSLEESLTNKQREVHEQLQRQALHAARLAMVSKRTGEEWVYTAPLPEDMCNAARRLGIREHAIRRAVAC